MSRVVPVEFCGGLDWHGHHGWAPMADDDDFSGEWRVCHGHNPNRCETHQPPNNLRVGQGEFCSACEAVRVAALDDFARFVESKTNTPRGSERNNQP